MARILAVAHQTAETPEFVAAVKRVAAATDPEFVLLVPATPVKHLTSWTDGESRAVASQKALSARERLESSGVRIVEAVVGDADPFQAIADTLAPGGFTSIIISTFPPGASRWLGVDLIGRVRNSFDLPVTHVIAH